MPIPASPAPLRAAGEGFQPRDLAGLALLCARSWGVPRAAVMERLEITDWEEAERRLLQRRPVSLDLGTVDLLASRTFRSGLGASSPNPGSPVPGRLLCGVRSLGDGRMEAAMAACLAVVLLALFICALMHGWARKDGKIVLFAALSFAIGKGALAAVTAWYAQKGGVTFRANVSMWARLAMGMQESPIAAGWYNNYTERFFSADVTAEQEKAQALADIGAQLCRMRENPAATLAFYREKLLTQWLEPACDMLWSGQLSEKAGRYTGVIRGIYGAPGALRGWMEGYMDAMQTAVYALAAVGGVCALRKKGGAALLMIPVTVLGGALYHLIFEAKAQYAYPYMVYMLPLAAAGLCRLEDGAARLICSGKKWVQRRAECARTSHRD